MPKLHFDITGDNSNLINSLNETQKRIDEVSKTMESVGKNFNMSTPKKQIKSLKTVIDDQEKVILKFKRDLVDLEKSANKAAKNGDMNLASKLTGDAEKKAKELQALVDENNKFKEALALVKKGTDSLSDSQEKQSGVMVTLLGGQQNYDKIIRGLPGPIRNAVTGMNQMTGAAKAFIATPLGAVLAALVLALQTVKTWLNGTAEGQMELAKVSGYLSGIINSLKDIVINAGKKMYEAFHSPKQALSDLADHIKDNVIKRIKALGGVVVEFAKMVESALQFDWSDVGEHWKSLITDVGTVFTGDETFGKDFNEFIGGVKDTANATSALKVREQQLHVARTKWMKEEAELDAQIAEQREKMYSGSVAERQAASAKAQELVNKKYAKQIEFAKEEYAIKKELNSLSSSTQEDLDKEAELQARIIDLQSQATRERSRFVRTAYSASESQLSYEMSIQNELNSLISSNEAKRIQLMKDGGQKQIATIEKTYEDQLRVVAETRKKWEEQNRKQTGNAELSKEQTTALTEATLLAEKERSNQLSELRKQHQQQYLKEYGNYEEKRLAITQEYNEKIENAADQYERKILRNQMNSELKALEKQYSASYALIFSNASYLSDNLLAKAIEETNKQIEEAQSKGDIQALTELYAKLREQLGEKGARTDGWFNGIINGIDDLNKAKERAEKATTSVELQNALADEQVALNKIQSSANHVSSAFNGLGDALSKLGGGLGEIGGMLQGLASQTSNLVTAFTSKNSADLIGVAVSGAVDIMSTLFASITANKEAQEQWNQTIKDCEHEYNMLMLDALDYKKQNIFGVENPYKKAIDGAKQYTEAIGALNSLMGQLEQGQIQVATKKAIDWSAIGKGVAAGASSGAALGAISGAGAFSWLTAPIGAAIGGVLGGVAGALSTKTEAVFQSLSKKYGDLWNENMELNPRLIADYEKLDDETKKVVDNWDEIKKKAEEAEEQMRENFSDLAGSLGDELSNALVTAFRNRDLTSAIDSFHSNVTKVIEDILQQMVFSATFGKVFDDLQKEFENSFAANGDQDLTDDIVRFDEAWQKNMDTYSEGMAQLQESFEKMGYSLWNGEDDASRGASTISVSQESFDVVTGMITNMMSHTYSISIDTHALTIVSNDIKNELSAIHSDTASIDVKMSALIDKSEKTRQLVEQITDRGVSLI